MQRKNWTNIFINVNSKWFFISSMALLLVSISVGGIHGKSYAATLLPSTKATVVYSTTDDEIIAELRILDMLLGRFCEDIHFVADDDLQAADVKDAGYLIYFGGIERVLPDTAKTIIRQFPGTVLAFGDNAEQLGDRFSFLEPTGSTIINQLSYGVHGAAEPLDQTYSIKRIKLIKGLTLLKGWNGIYEYPMAVGYKKAYYFASKDLFDPFNFAVGQTFNTIFDIPPTGHRAYLRLEDIHPMSDPALLRAAGDYLISKQIPFMIAVIPVYTNPDTSQTHHMRDVPELVQTLKHLQSNGASIILHGYTHQYRANETGEGFEFWDVKHNTPLISPPDQDIQMKNRYLFPDESAYQSYIDNLRAFEERYIRNKIEQGIRELADQGLYPLAFEAPHYTMSQNGYRIVADYFNYILGQAQVSDQDWQQMSVAPFATKPSFLHGMTLWPETVGYYDPTASAPLDILDRRLGQIRAVDGGVVGAFFHTYLGVESLKQMIDRMESGVDALEWLDLKKAGATVRSPYVRIDSDASGNMQPEFKEMPAEEGYTSFPSGTEWVMWGVAALVTVMVTLFFLYTLSIRHNLGKQLFGEKSING